jgi:hypothetical protein
MFLDRRVRLCIDGNARRNTAASPYQETIHKPARLRREKAMRFKIGTAVVTTKLLYITDLSPEDVVAR